MLRLLKKPVSTAALPTHVDLFVEHYERLKGWAMRFTEYDHELAEDLLHDAFIHFTLSKPDLGSIENVEGFLYVVMRNLHLSQIRKAARTPLRPVSVVEYDTVDMSFWASDPRDRIRMRDELSAVCQYACIRKESAKAGSVLILRFFHGYYPEEIAKILRTNAFAVTKRLQQARSEAKLFLEDPERLSFIGDKPVIKTSKFSQIGDDLRLELRKQIFASRQGECHPENELNEI
jgi:RNA polymerase sigma factor (sigma-70 family)